MDKKPKKPNIKDRSLTWTRGYRNSDPWELFAKAQRKYIKYQDSELQALETENEGLKGYVRHEKDCPTKNMFAPIGKCNCGLDELLNCKGGRKK